jgi:hypothetical protein
MLEEADVASKDYRNRILLYVAAQNGKSNVAWKNASSEAKDDKCLMTGRKPLCTLLKERADVACILVCVGVDMEATIFQLGEHGGYCKPSSVL